MAWDFFILHVFEVREFIFDNIITCVDFRFAQIFELLSWQNESSSVFILTLEINFLRFYKVYHFFDLFCIKSLSILNLSSQIFSILHIFRQYFARFQANGGGIGAVAGPNTMVSISFCWMINYDYIFYYENWIGKSLNILKKSKSYNLDYGSTRMH